MACCTRRPKYMLCGRRMLGKRASRLTEYHVGQFRATTVFFRYPAMRAVICIGQERPRLMTQARMAVCNTGKDGHVYVITSYYTGEDGHV